MTVSELGFSAMTVKRNPGFMKLRHTDAAREITISATEQNGNKIYLNADSLLLNLLGDSNDKFAKGLQQDGGAVNKKGHFR
jgi:hypothetical protein